MDTTMTDASPNPLKRQHGEEAVDSNSMHNSDWFAANNSVLPSGHVNGNQPPSTPSQTAASAQNGSQTGQAGSGQRERSQSVTSILSDLSDLPPTPAKIPVVRVPELPQEHRNAFSALTGIPEPPKKKQKLTFAEQEDRRIKKEIAAAEKTHEREKREKERRDKEAEREAERRKKEAERQAKEAEKETERKKKEAEKQAKEEEKKKKEAEREEKRLLKEAEHAKKEEQRKTKEGEKAKAEEEKRKKERNQPKLMSFFAKPKAVAKESLPDRSGSPEKSREKAERKDKEKEEYEKLWPPFFVQNNVALAQPPGQRDEAATNKVEDDLDLYLSGKKRCELERPLQCTDLFNMPSICFARRGKKPTPVKHIMEELLGTGGSARPIDLTTESYNRKLKAAREALSKVPYKILKFAEDVRPPYTGTWTRIPAESLEKLARRPFGRYQGTHLDYGYDSEAEWEPPGEDEEDLGSEDEEEEVDEQDDFDGFLDDADDELTKSRKLAMQMQGDLEPKSTGLCFQDEQGRVSNILVSHFKMGIINENMRSNEPIDPFSDKYWSSPITQTFMNPPRFPLSGTKDPPSAHLSTSPPQPHAAPHNAKITDMLGIQPKSTSSASSPLATSSINTVASRPRGRPPNPDKQPSASKKMIEPEHLKEFKNEVQGSALSKIGLIEVLNKKFEKVSKAAIKNTLEAYAQRVGVKEADKRWVWRGTES